MQGIKHLVKCKCVLPQFKSQVIQHQFIVFSVIDDNNEVIPKFVQCNNCGAVHKVFDICQSDVMKDKENLNSIKTIEEIELGLPEKLSTILKNNNCDVPTYEKAQFIIENKQWGEFVVLTSDYEDGLKQGKYIQILGENLYKVDTFVRNESV